MNRRTKIEWVKNPDGSQGYTWNPITGCLNHTPEGLCLGGMFPCYAFKLANGRLRERYLANPNFPIGTDMHGLDWVDPEAFNDPFYPRFWDERLKEPYIDITRLQRMKGIFVCDMGELFGDWIPRDWQGRVFQVIRENPWHRFYLLTKQPQNLIKFSPFPDNCWVGVTATNSDQYELALWYLNRIEAKVKYISFEPLLEGIIMKPPIEINWAIIGAQTKPLRLPSIQWIEDLVYLLDRYQIPIFQKDNLKSLLGNNLRQEIPNVR